MESIDLAYAAGILDGEGCITTKWPARKQLAVEVKMVSRPCVEKFAAAVGGLCVSGYERRHGRFRQWQCRLYDRNAERVLTALLPYLCEKKEQALAAIAFRNAEDDTSRAAHNERLKALKLVSY